MSDRFHTHKFVHVLELREKNENNQTNKTNPTSNVLELPFTREHLSCEHRTIFLQTIAHSFRQQRGGDLVCMGTKERDPVFSSLSLTKTVS